MFLFALLTAACASRGHGTDGGSGPGITFTQSDSGESADAEAPDSGASDASDEDAAVLDASIPLDASVETDASVTIDAGRSDASVTVDAGFPDASMFDASVPVDAGNPFDAGEPDAADPFDSGILDAGIADAGEADASMEMDASVQTGGGESDSGMMLLDAGMVDAGPPVCGNGAPEEGELCDSETAACASLAATWTAGTAVCRADCSGYDVSACTRATPTSMNEIVEPATRNPNLWATARCNDGTAADIAVRLSQSGTSNVWVFNLQGPDWCDDNSRSCAGRSLQTRSQWPYPDSTRNMYLESETGILNLDSTDNPAFADANVVYGHYCSSDAWSGATATRRSTNGDPVNGWFFSGRLNFKAMVEIVLQRFGLDDSNAAVQVLLAGQGSGALGAAANADQLVQLLPQTYAGGRVLLLIDEGWIPNWTDTTHPWGSASVTNRQMFDVAAEFWASAFNPLCESAQPSPGDCLLGTFFYGPLASPSPAGLGLPTLVQQNALDPEYLFEQGMIAAPSTVATEWHDLLRTETAGVANLFSGATEYAPTPAAGQTGFFYDAIALNSAQWIFAPPAEPAETFRELLIQFWSGEPPQQVVFDGP